MSAEASGSRAAGSGRYRVIASSWGDDSGAGCAGGHATTMPSRSVPPESGSTAKPRRWWGTVPRKKLSAWRESAVSICVGLAAGNVDMRTITAEAGRIMRRSPQFLVPSQASRPVESASANSRVARAAGRAPFLTSRTRMRSARRSATANSESSMVMAGCFFKRCFRLLRSGSTGQAGRRRNGLSTARGTRGCGRGASNGRRRL